MKIKKQNTQKSVIKRKLKFQDYKNCLEAAQIEKKKKKKKRAIYRKLKLKQIVLKNVKKNF